MTRHSSSSSDDISIFPPSNHENLQIPVDYSLPKQSSFSSSSSSSLSSPRSSTSSLSDDSSSSSEDLPPSPCLVVTQVPTDKISGWLGLGFRILRAKVANAATSFGGVRLALTGTFVFWCFSAWLRRRKELRLKQERIHHLMSVVKERDARIVELLNQIARLNEVLVAPHRAG